MAIPGAVLALLTWGQIATSAQGPNDLSGLWTLNRQLSQLPEEIGFSADFLPATPGTTGGGGGRRGGGGGGGGTRGESRGPQLRPETQEDARRIRFLTDEVRLPPDRLTIAVTPAQVSITPDRGAARTLQPGLKDEVLTLGPVAAAATATWEGDRLAVVYEAGPARTVRYTYSRTQSPSQLIVEVEFVGRGGGDKVRRIYEPTPSQDSTASQSSAAPPQPEGQPSSGPPPRLALPRGALPPGALPPAPPPASAPASPPAAAAVDERPDAALRGLTRVGLVIEGIGADAAKCGLQEGPLETAITKRLTDAGFRVLRNTDDESYFYVNINAVTASAGFCVSRYDVTLYSHAAAPLAHTTAPVPLQVELLHKGGMAGGAPQANADAVTKNILEYVDQFATRVRGASK